MTFGNGDVWRPPHAEFIGVYRYEQQAIDTSPADDIEGYCPDYRDIVPETVPFFAVVRELDGFTDTPTADELTHSIQSHGYEYKVVQRRPDPVEQVSESTFFDKARALEEEGHSQREATELAVEDIGYDPHRVEETDLIFYWPSV